jgi:hypothetical protein
MKFIFLDIDGVLATNRTYNLARKMPGWDEDKPSRNHLLTLLDKEKIALLNEIIQVTGAQIILCSTWRFPFNIGGHDAISILIEAGLNATFAGKTNENLGYRGKEIELEIRDRNFKAEDYIIIDDDKTVSKGLKLLGHNGSRWIQTAEATGLKPRHRDTAIKLLSDSK